MEEWRKIYEEEIAFLPNTNELEDNDIALLQDYISSGVIKTYEEQKNEKIIKIMEKYKNWLNEMLEDKEIYYINRIKYEYTAIETLTKGGKYILETYVKKEDESTAIELINEYEKATICDNESQKECESEKIEQDNLPNDVRNDAEVIANILIRFLFVILTIIILLKHVLPTIILFLINYV